MKNKIKNLTLYVPGAFYSDKENPDWKRQFEEFENSGFTTIINWAFHVGPNGGISNQGQITENGTFKGSSEWNSRLQGLKTNGSVNSLLISLWGDTTFDNIQQLIASGEHEEGGKLYKNFEAFYNNMGFDGVDLDYENSYFDVDMIVKLTLMLHKIGFTVTFCPYMSKTNWAAAYKEISKQSPNAVTGINLQCYSGGCGNKVSDWIAAFDNKVPVYPGVGLGWKVEAPSKLSCGDVNYRCVGKPADVQAIFQMWQQNDQITGGFIWKYFTLKDLAYAMKKGLTPPTSGQ